MERLSFKVEAQSTTAKARACSFTTLHNHVQTPVFMPVGTHGAVRSQRREDLLDADVQVLLANTYHLLLRPGVEIFRQFGGIHQFMNWPRSVLTDSGGFQIFCLPNSRVMKEEGAFFKSYVDHQIVCLSPEKSIETQKLIGSDIMMVLDQCVPSTVDKDIARDAMKLTHRWAQRSLDARGEAPSSLFGIVQGACYDDLRKESARVITSMDFDGFAIGGLAVGEAREERENCTDLVTEYLPANRPRYLMGVGTPLDLLEAVHRGVDMFDCILPTAMASQGKAFTSQGRKDFRRANYFNLEDPVDAQCSCYTCKNYSIAYIYHLLRVQEKLATQLLGLHNIAFYTNLMRSMRLNILNNTWDGFYQTQRHVLDARDSYGPRSIHSARAAREKMSMQLGRYEIVTTDGVSRILDKASQEVMHSVSDPISEAQSVYVAQSRLVERLKSTHPDQEPLVLWDVGLGAAANALAAIQHVENSQEYEAAEFMGRSMRVLKIISFENNLDSLKLALKFPKLFPYLKGPPAFILLSQKVWVSPTGRVEWHLVEGDFSLEKKNVPPPDIVFFDPFSFKTDSKLWTVQEFQDLFWLSQGRAVEIFTYTASTAIRAALLYSGFYVASGVATGPKAETTIACTPESLSLYPTKRSFLSNAWLDKWRRSDAAKPFGLEGVEEGIWRSKVGSHQQFES